ncbi:MAG: hypothetical protein ACP5I8_00740 [Phycisphaerae bacterium]
MYVGPLLWMKYAACWPPLKPVGRGVACLGMIGRWSTGWPLRLAYGLEK